MTDPLGYIDLAFGCIELAILLGLLALFYVERHTYGRDRLDGMTVGRLLVHNLATFGGYGMYWRLKASVALSGRDRIPAGVWVALLALLFCLLVSPINILWLIIGWNFGIRYRWQQASGVYLHWFWTLVFGHLYMASVMNGQTDRLPVDFRQQRPERRKLFFQRYAVFCGMVLLLLAGGYGALVAKRSRDFAKIPVQFTTPRGYWYSSQKNQEYIYSQDELGHRQVFWLNELKQSYWAGFEESVKVHEGRTYSYKWFDCVRSVGDAREIEAKDFDRRRLAFQKNDEAPAGWQLGELLKSPWRCEWMLLRNI